MIDSFLWFFLAPKLALVCFLSTSSFFGALNEALMSCTCFKLYCLSEGNMRQRFTARDISN